RRRRGNRCTTGRSPGPWYWPGFRLRRRGHRGGRRRSRPGARRRCRQRRRRRRGRGRTGLQRPAGRDGAAGSWGQLRQEGGDVSDVLVGETARLHLHGRVLARVVAILVERIAEADRRLAADEWHVIGRIYVLVTDDRSEE